MNILIAAAIICFLVGIMLASLFLATSSGAKRYRDELKARR